jgi:hypothetical protein
MRAGAFMSGLKVLAALGAAALLAACLPQRDMKASFSLADHQPWAAKGNAGVDGEGFIRRPNGWLARCSGNKVYLVPASLYFQEWIGIRRAGAQVANAAELTKQHREAQRETQCDQRGRFAFSDLPPGKWFVITRISYEARNDDFTEDALYVAEVETTSGKRADVILSNPNRI